MDGLRLGWHPHGELHVTMMMYLGVYGKWMNMDTLKESMGSCPIF